MNIRIVPIDRLEAGVEPSPAPSWLQPHPATLYTARAARLRALSANHPMADYLGFAADLVAAQARRLAERPLTPPEELAGLVQRCAEHGMPPLAPAGWRGRLPWQDDLDALLATIASKPLAEALQAAVNRLAQASRREREGWASALLSGDSAAGGVAVAPFLWAALSLNWSQLAAAIDGRLQADPGADRSVCPVCAAPPVASVVRLGAEPGHRYLHCSLCESEWHVVRAQCSCCSSSRDLGYWSLDSVEAAVKAESCGDCHSYLKVLYQDKDVAVEPVADDLASLALDWHVEEQGFASSGQNPFLFVQ
ncbi:formate dehydrogenase accessory protein FdhE [Pseudogulbenkiania ferrooxidans]|uniref:Protein FdhE homolog n=1 Tax=Pseudogulbenkiania ferrooxidans 2002 TaxID=279714 RepID=B9Z0H5_9NEIS|nr:formate dehydrogenase accessory protein FdhE [Pseudogulbenkiania ferrooxidans]EEG09581.1 formate dehydrogenase accessory protein FdhE [Pseudogulbenkiania ferrooxidans 2002]